MKKSFLLVYTIISLVLSACSTISSPGNRTLSSDQEKAEPTIRDSTSFDSPAQPN